MRVVHLSTFGGRGTHGGAFASAFRIHSGLRALGVDSFMLCRRSDAADESVVPLAQSGLKALKRLYSRLDELPLALFGDRGVSTWTTGWVGVPGVATLPLLQSADIIGLYWVGGGFLSIAELGNLLAMGKPVVWRLSDMWAFTGGCHHSFGCERYQASCGRCPQLRRSSSHDLSHWVWRSKKRRWSLSNLTVVTPSRWLAKACAKSGLLSGARITTVPTGIDLSTFRPTDKREARRALGLPQDQTLVLIAGTDPKKGGHHALEAIRLAAARSKHGADLHLVAFGASDSIEFDATRTHALGRLDERRVVLAYSACDMFLAPFVQDNLPQTVLEALACCCPVVGFRSGGVDDAVDHGETGLLCEAGNVDQLAAAIVCLLEDPPQRQRMGEAARTAAETRFSMDRQAREFALLYQEELRRVREARRPSLAHDAL